MIEQIVELVDRAGAAIMEVYASGDLRVAEKADSSPLTEADLRSHRLITAGLERLEPRYPVLSEESAAVPYAERRRWQRYWLVDPLDGTRDFLSRNGEFTVNVALVENHRAILGVVGVPAQGLIYHGELGHGAFRRERMQPARPIVVSRCADPVRIVGSRSHRGSSLDAFLARVPAHELLAVGSALKFCLVAEGRADVYPRLGPTCEWDTAAAQAVLESAGGKVVTLDGADLGYNSKEELLNPHFVAFGDSARDWLALVG
ncbi:MAG: 3'(2'),5'-bisphosphate nucleotidase CysQ [Steroidobacteraceae bacterium]